MMPLPSYSQIADLIKKGATLEAQERIMELREAAQTSQEENLRLRQELQAATDRRRELEEQLKLMSQISFKDNVCWIEGDSCPICPLCWEDDGKVVHLSGPYPQNNGDKVYECQKHEKPFITRVGLLNALRLST